jgi:hypothetical protein
VIADFIAHLPKGENKEKETLTMDSVMHIKPQPWHTLNAKLLSHLQKPKSCCARIYRTH